MNSSTTNKPNPTNKPTVSLCTPTFNRRPFIPYMVQCFLHQTYPKDLVEWIIIDDGTDPIGDLVQNIPQVKYFYFNEKMILGKKRNLMHSKCSGDIIVYMDDDDYYPPERISHAVETLENNPSFLIAGSSEMHIYFESRNAVFQCGPYKPYHSTAATFAFRRELLLTTNYNDENAIFEEKQFTKNYTIPLVQLNPLKSILVFSHKHNSLNKEKLLLTPEQTKTVPSPYTVDDFVREPELKQFYMVDMNRMLEDYEPGLLKHKPEVLEQTKKTEEDRERRIQEVVKQAEEKEMRVKEINRQTEALTNQTVATTKQPNTNQYEDKIAHLNKVIADLLAKIRTLTAENKELTAKLYG